MVKFTKQTVYDYIMCNDLSDDYIEELEKDSKFMIEVIEATNDKEMLSFCNKSLFINFEFVEYVINKFRDDKDLIIKVANYYLENVLPEEDYEIDKLEINILMKNIIGPIQDVELSKYRLSVLTEFLSLNVAICKQLETDENEYVDSNMHFRSIRDIFLGRKIIIDDFASMILDDIFYNNKEMPLEKLIHKYTKNKKDLEEGNINRLLIKIIGDYDIDLSRYVQCNISLLNGLKRDLKHIYYRFDFYIKNENNEKIAVFEKELSNYLEENSSIAPNYGYIAMEQYIIKRLHLEEIYLLDEDYQEFVNSEYYDSEEWRIVEESLRNKSDFASYKFYKYALDIAKKIFVVEDYEEPDEYLINEAVVSTLKDTPKKRKLIPFPNKK